MSTPTHDTLTYDHPRWPEFARAVWTRPTECDDSHTHTRAALRAIGADEDASIAWLKGEGGYCDCEVAFNVAIRHLPRGAGHMSDEPAGDC